MYDLVVKLLKNDGAHGVVVLRQKMVSNTACMHLHAFADMQNSWNMQPAPCHDFYTVMSVHASTAARHSSTLSAG